MNTDVVDDSTSLVVYVGRNEEHVRPLVEAFESETGLTVEARYGSTGELATTILQEGEHSPADVFFAQDPVYIGALVDAKLLTSLPDDIIGRVPDGISGANNEWVGVTGRRRVMAYNPAFVTERDLPQSINELTEPSWRGRVGLAPTHSSFVSFIASMVTTEGEEAALGWLEAIAANDPHLFSGNHEIVEAVAAGDVDVGLVNHYYALQMAEERGSADAANRSFRVGDPGDVLMPTTIGMLESSLHRSAALDFIRFMLRDSSQRHFLDNVKEYPLVDGIGTPPGENPLDVEHIRGMHLDEVGDNLTVATTLIAQAGLI
ncbi:extracellular solute-binding protein [Salinibacterium sp. G-O1]|uniref:extracellular solute-binding protein n=1 Tax=Salinibacterium sp. G-O1 TaxID=3046208 RepID=UPI0024B9074E|nr:extracellular solute-binding protein [Salinibacterium sp. G-O1]MDJ0333986.1 extracellular solute-binding protein [Salinibacterium sp. G-O1]